MFVMNAVMITLKSIYIVNKNSYIKQKIKYE